MVSIIIVERERFRYTEESVRSILAHRENAQEIVYVTGNPPKKTWAFLKKTERENPGFFVVKANRCLRTNEARNIALSKIKPGHDVVFIGNDVIVRKGWLSRMVRCSDETKAGIVGPLTLEWTPGTGTDLVHDAGSRVIVKNAGEGRPKWEMVHVLHRKYIKKRLPRREFVDLVEFHCLFVKRKLLNRIGLNENFEDIIAHVDFCLEAKKNGAKTVMEPAAKVAFANPVTAPEMDLADFRLFQSKWADRHSRDQLLKFARKWGIDPNGQFIWLHRHWAFWYKASVFTAFGVLNPLERLLWRVARVKINSDSLRELVENHLVRKIFNRVWKADLTPGA